VYPWIQSPGEAGPVGKGWHEVTIPFNQGTRKKNMAKQQKMKHQLEQIKIENDYMLVSKTKQGVLRSP